MYEMLLTGLGMRRHQEISAHIVVLLLALMMHSSLNTVWRAKSSLELMGANKKKRCCVFICARSSANVCALCFSAFVPVPYQPNMHTLCYMRSRSCLGGHSEAICGCNQMSVSSVNVAELL